MQKVYRMAKEIFDIETELNDLKRYIAKAAKTGKIDKALEFSLIERVTSVLEKVAKKLEALEDRVDLIEDKF